MDNIYLHAIYAFQNKYNQNETLRVLKNILKSDAILSRRLQRYRDPYGFNGLDYISLCDYDRRNMHHERFPNYTAFKTYVTESLSIVFPKDKITVIKPQMVDFIGAEHKNLKTMEELGLSPNKRYSDLYDEVQVKDSVPLSLMSSITMPLQKMSKTFYSERIITYLVQKEIEQIKELLIKYNHEVPIYDIDTFIPLEDTRNVKTLVKKYYNKNIVTK